MSVIVDVLEDSLDIPPPLPSQIIVMETEIIPISIEESFDTTETQKCDLPIIEDMKTNDVGDLKTTDIGDLKTNDVEYLKTNDIGDMKTNDTDTSLFSEKKKMIEDTKQITEVASYIEVMEISGDKCDHWSYLVPVDSTVDKEVLDKLEDGLIDTGRFRLVSEGLPHDIAAYLTTRNNINSLAYQERFVLLDDEYLVTKPILNKFINEVEWEMIDVAWSKIGVDFNLDHMSIEYD